MLTHNLIFYEGRAKLLLRAVQGESGATKYQIELRDESGNKVLVPATAQCFFYVQRGNKAVQVPAQSNGSGRIDFTLTFEAVREAGSFDCVLQAISDDEDFRIGNITLLVEPCKIEGLVESAEEVSVVANVVRNAEKIDDLFLFCQAQTKELKGAMEKYYEGASLETSGTTETALDFFPVFDAAGNAYLLDRYHWNGTGSRASGDLFQTYQTFSYAPSSESIHAQIAVGGERVLIAAANKLIWGGMTESGTVSFDAPITNPITQTAGYFGGLYAQGKYFLYPIPASDMTPSPTGGNLYCLQKNGAAATAVTLPGARQLVTAMAFDPATGNYLVAGRNSYSTVDENQTDNRKSFFYLTADPTDPTKWEELYFAEDTDFGYRGACFFQGSWYLIPQSPPIGKAKLIRIGADKLASNLTLTPAGGFEPCRIQAGNAGLLLTDSTGKMAFSNDGESFQWFEAKTGWAVTTGMEAAVFGRYFLISGGNAFALYRGDLPGESLLDELQELKDGYEEAQGKVTGAAGEMETLRAELEELIEGDGIGELALSQAKERIDEIEARLAYLENVFFEGMTAGARLDFSAGDEIHLISGWIDSDSGTLKC